MTLDFVEQGGYVSYTPVMFPIRRLCFLYAGYVSYTLCFLYARAGRGSLVFVVVMSGFDVN
jgi:hypothetical protein